jgi:hypothetical protein
LLFRSEEDVRLAAGTRDRRVMDVRHRGTEARGGRVEIAGDVALREGLGPVLRKVLEAREGYYVVSLDGVGRCGEVLVAISSPSRRLPLLFGRGDLEPGYVASVVRQNVERFAL